KHQLRAYFRNIEKTQVTDRDKSSSPVSHPTKNIAPPASIGWGDVRFLGSPVVGTAGTTVSALPTKPIPRTATG
ncbi:hypothetical protein, partial [Mycobacteroides abscessus]|uniref:hypothetical protein n=1 Tax=Mycobacteroides abscessus TaxID=36809 RepID=UPI001A960F35